MIPPEVRQEEGFRVVWKYLMDTTLSTASDRFRKLTIQDISKATGVNQFAVKRYADAICATDVFKMEEGRLFLNLPYIEAMWG